MTFNDKIAKHIIEILLSYGFKKKQILIKPVSENWKIKELIFPSLSYFELSQDESNFLSGLASWELVKISGNKTLVRLRASQTPAFWIPPFIGPTLIKSVLFKELEETFTNLEILASS